ncbi:hypothetical protein CHUAL_010126 [Chamberlinius hualienensis]
MASGECSSDDCDSEVDSWIFYRDRPEWENAIPTPQDEGEFPVVQIAYSEKFRDVFDYFRTVLRTNEISERSFRLTEDAASLNPANYTVWHYRRILLKGLIKDLKEELKYVGEMIVDHPKTYQLWHHRGVVVGWLQDSTEELSFTEKVLEIDAKNYHAWQHRQWVLKTFNVWENEVPFIDRLLAEDVRNNSAWNHRYFVINSTTTFTENVVNSEVSYTIDKIRLAVHNESAWNYLSGILYLSETLQHPEVTEFVNSLYNAGARSSYLLSFMIDMAENELKSGAVKVDSTKQTLQKALDLCHDLATEHDTIRCEYWKYVARCLGSKYKLDIQ